MTIQLEGLRPNTEYSAAIHPQKQDVSRRSVLKQSAAGALAVAASSSLLPSTAEAAPLLSVAGWERRFLNIWNSQHSTYSSYSTRADSSCHYDLAYGVDACVSMFQATGKTQYLDRAILYIENVMNSSRASYSLGSRAFGDSYRGWVSRRSDTYGREVPLFESYLWRYAGRLLRAMRNNSSVMGRSTYQSKYRNILSFMEVHILDKWYSRGRNFIYRENAHMASHWAYIALDLSLLTSSSSRRSVCSNIYNGINESLPNYPGRSLRRQLTSHPRVSNAYFWQAPWGSYSRPGTDCAHGNGVVSYIVEAIDIGREWTRTDAAKLINTLDNAIWPTSSRWAYYVDGSGLNGGWFNDGWCKLGRYSAALQKRLESHSRGQNMQLFGNCAHNARILGA